MCVFLIPGHNLYHSLPTPSLLLSSGILGFSLSRYNSGHHRALLQVENCSPYFPARESWQELGEALPTGSVFCDRPRFRVKTNSLRRPLVWQPLPPATHQGDWSISLAMPQCLLWICLAVWEASGDLPFIAENDAALMVNW